MNVALPRRLAFMMPKRHPSKDSIASKQFAAAPSTAFLEEALAANVNSSRTHLTKVSVCRLRRREMH
jgi:hypothetical protein